MSYFTRNQEKALKEVLLDVVNGKVDKITATMVKEYDLIKAVDKNRYMETIKQDIFAVADDEKIELTEEQAEVIASIVESKYDHSHYNEFISDVIQENI